MKNPFHFTKGRFLGAAFGVASIIYLCLDGAGGFKPFCLILIANFLLVVFLAKDFSGTID